MAIQTRIMQQISSVDTFNALQELIKNPEAIVMAHEEIRKQVALTAEEKKKAEEGREFLSRYDALKAELEEEIKTHESLKGDFQQEKEAFRQYMEDQIAKIKVTGEKLSSEINAHESIKVNHLAEVVKHSNLVGKLNKEKEAFQAERLAAEATLRKWEAQLEEYEAKIRKREDILRDKETKLKSILG